MSDVMLLGVLRMPTPPMEDVMAWAQLKSRAEQAADRIEADAEQIDRLRMDLENTRAEALLAVAAERERCAKVCESLANDWHQYDGKYALEDAASKIRASATPPTPEPS